MSAGRRPHRVRLEDRPVHRLGPPEVMRPPTLFVEVQQLSPGVTDEDHVSYNVFGPYHRQVNTDTVLHWTDGGLTRELHVMGVQNVDGLGRDMVMHCQEVRTP